MAVPPEMPVIAPETGSTVATPVALLVQEPPVTPSVYVTVTPWQNVVGVPVIDVGGMELTVTVLVAVPQLLV